MHKNDYDSLFLWILLDDSLHSLLSKKIVVLQNQTVLVKLLLSFYTSWLLVIPYRLLHLNTALVTQLWVEYQQPATHVTKLLEEERLSCEDQITIEECVKALDTFENGKTPGNDGIPTEFYKTFWSCVGELMTDVFNYSFDSGEMSNSQKQAIITLIDKKDKDRTYLENWRPISLVNADAKLASKVISNRIFLE